MTAFLFPTFSGRDRKVTINSLEHGSNHSCLLQENERLFQEWLWRKHLLEQMKKGLSKIGNSRFLNRHHHAKFVQKDIKFLRLSKGGDGVVNSKITVFFFSLLRSTWQAKQCNNISCFWRLAACSFYWTTLWKSYRI